MANFGRKMWAWKHSLKGVANTEAEPQMITPPARVSASKDGSLSGGVVSGYKTERAFKKGGYNPEGEDGTDLLSGMTGFLYAKKEYYKASSRFSEESNPASGPAHDYYYSTLDITGEGRKFIFASPATKRSHVSFDLQNCNTDRFHPNYTPTDHYSTLMVSGISSLDFLHYQAKRDQYYNPQVSDGSDYQAGLNSRTGIGDATSGNPSISLTQYEDDNYIPNYYLYNTYKNVSGTETLACSLELSQIKGQGFNWNEYEGGSPEFDLWGQLQWKSVDANYPITALGDYNKKYKTWNGTSYPVLRAAMDLNYRYSGKTVKYIPTANSRWSTDAPSATTLSGYTGYIPDDTATIDIAFEVELALQRYGVSTSTQVVKIGQSGSTTYTRKVMSYVAGNPIFYKGDHQFMTGTYIAVPVYCKTRAVGEDITSTPQANGYDYPDAVNYSILGQRSHVYKYVIVVIRLEKPYNVGSVITGSGRVLDWETEQGTISENYSVVSGKGSGLGTFNETQYNYDKFEAPFEQTRRRSNAKMVGSVLGLSGQTNPVTCFRVTESGMHGLYSGGTVYDNAPVAAGSYSFPNQGKQYTRGKFVDNGFKLVVYENYDNYLQLYSLTRAYDPSSATGVTSSLEWYAERGSYNVGNSNSFRDFVFNSDGTKLYILHLRNIDDVIFTTWDLTTAYDPSTGTISGITEYADSWLNTTYIQYAEFGDDGDYIYLVGGELNKEVINKISLSTAYDVTSHGSSTSQIDVTTNFLSGDASANLGRILWNDDGSELNLYVWKSGGSGTLSQNYIGKISVGTNWTISASDTFSTEYTIPSGRTNDRAYDIFFNGDGTAFYFQFGSGTPKSIDGENLTTAYDISSISPVTAKESENFITRFKSNSSGDFARSYFWHVTDYNGSGDTDNPTGRDPFPSTGLSTVVDTIDFSGSFPYCVGYDSTNYPRHTHPTDSFIRSFRLSNCGKFLYILWVTDTIIPNSSSASIKQWVERFFIAHPEGVDGDDAWQKGGTRTPTPQSRGVYFAGTTDIYTIQGDSSGGYLSSATAVDVSPNGQHLQVLQSEAHRAGVNNYKPMIVEHYLGGNDMLVRGTGTSTQFPKGEIASTNPVLHASGSNESAYQSFHWPLIPCKPGLFAETGRNASDADFGNGGSNLAVVFDRTYRGGYMYWKWHRQRWDYNGENPNANETSTIVADSNYDIIPSDFSWNIEGTQLYLYGAFNDSNSGTGSGGGKGLLCYEGSPYMLRVPVYASEMYNGCGQDPDTGNPTGYGTRTDYLFNFLYTHSIRGIANDLLTTEKRASDTQQDGTLYRSYFYPTDTKVYSSVGNSGWSPLDSYVSNESAIHIKLRYTTLNSSPAISLDNHTNLTYGGSVPYMPVKKSDQTKAKIEGTDDDRYFGVITYIFDCSDPSVTSFPVIKMLNGTTDVTNIILKTFGTAGTTDAYLVMCLPSDTATSGGGSNSSNGAIDFHMFHPDQISTQTLTGGIRMHGNGRDFLEMCALPLYYIRDNPNTQYDVSNTTSFRILTDGRAAGNLWATPTRNYVPPANNSALVDGTDSTDVARSLDWSPWAIINRSAAPPVSKNMSNMDQTYPLASVFAHHHGGRYLYMISEDTTFDSENDPNNTGQSRFRPLELCIIPIQSKIETNIAGATQYSQGYDTYFGQPVDELTYNDNSNYWHNYRDWGYTQDEDKAVEPPRMNTEAGGGDWGASMQLSASRNAGAMYLTMASRWSPDSNTRWLHPFMEDGYQANDMQGDEFVTIANMPTVYYSAYARKGFANYQLNKLNIGAEAINTELGFANNALPPQHIYKSDNGQFYWYGVDMCMGRWGLRYYAVGTDSDYVYPYQGFSWGLNNTQALDPGDSPFINSGFMQNNWDAFYGEEDPLDIPKFIVSNPYLGSKPAYSRWPEFITILQRMRGVRQNYGSVPPPNSWIGVNRGAYYVTKQQIYNIRSHTKLGKAYDDGGRKQLSPYYQMLHPTGSYTQAASGGTIQQQTCEYSSPSSLPLSYQVPSVRSFRFANKGRYLFVLISGKINELNGQPASNAAFTLQRYTLETPYDITSSTYSTLQTYTFYEDTYNFSEQYTLWWGSMAYPASYFGADFALHPDGTKFWVIGMNSKQGSGFARNINQRTLLREFDMSSAFDLSTTSTNGFAVYDSQSIVGQTELSEPPRSLEISPDGNTVYWTMSYMNNQASTTANGLALNSENNVNPFQGTFNAPWYSSIPEPAKMRHFKSTLPQPYNLKQPDQTSTETARNEYNQSITRTIVGVPWYADEGAAQRIRFVNQDRWFRTNLASNRTDNSDPDYNRIYWNQVLNQSVGGFSSFVNEEEGHKVQKVDGTWNIGNAGMFTPLFTTTAFTDAGARKNHCPQDMFLFEVSDEQDIVLLSDTQLRIYSFVLNNSTKGW